MNDRHRRRPGLVLLGVCLAVLAIVGAVAVATIQPLWLAVAVTAIVGLLVIGIGLLPRGRRKRAASQTARQQ